MKVKLEGKVCGVCGDKALGCNFNAITCESCKAFFRRNALIQKDFKCPFSEHCEITPVTRRFCQKCRLDKCFSIGMCKNLIMSEEDKEMKRKKILENRCRKRMGISGFKRGFKKVKKDTYSSDSRDSDLMPNPHSEEALEDEPVLFGASTVTLIPHFENGGDANSAVTEEFALISTNDTQVVSSSDDVPMIRSMLNNTPQRQRLSQTVSEHACSFEPVIQTDNNGNIEEVGDSKPSHSSNISSTADHLSEVTRDVIGDVQSSSVELNSLESILCEAIKLEFQTFSPISHSNSKELNDAERAKLNELIVANKVLSVPLDEELKNSLLGQLRDPQIKLEADPALLDVINLTAIAIRRLIKMAKKINAFKNMCQEDQVALLKGGSTEIMILRSAMNYDPKKQSWQIPRKKQSINLNVDVLKLAKNNAYEEHEKFFKTFDPRWRADENIILIMCAITLFTPDRPKVVHKDVIKLEQVYIFIVFLFLLPNFGKSDENIYVLNNRRPLHIVSDKFLSVSVDPAILLTRINLSDISLKMVRHLSPAYVRIAGPSTEFVKYIDSDDKSIESGSNGVDNVIVTPSVWFAINEWFGMANLTPVFGINDAETTMGVWNPKSILPLLELSDTFNLTCLWQLGYDCSNKTDVQYVEDLKILRHILDAFPDKKETWKIVASNLRECSTRQGARKILEQLKNIADYAMWEHSENEIENKQKWNDFVRPFVTSERNPNVWTTGSRSHHPVTFETALEWAKEAGLASKHGFDVILRQPRMHEFFVDTPVFWFSLLYKTLVGNIILDMKSLELETNANAFAYCAKNQNNFIHSGAMVIMIVNEDDREYNCQVRTGTLARSMEVQSYILTAKSDRRTIYLNGERLKSSMLNEDKIVFTPKLRRAKPLNGISFSVPPNSIAFFVLPGAKISICSEKEEDMTSLLQEIREDQELPFSEEVAVDLESRLSNGNAMGLKEMQKHLEEELAEDEEFYYNGKAPHNHKLNAVLETLKDEYEKQASKPDPKFKIDDETRKNILERAKVAEAQKKITESEQRLLNLGKLFLEKSNNIPQHVEEKKDSYEIISPVIEKTKKISEIKDIVKSKTVQDLLANKPNLDKFTLPKVNKINTHEDFFKLNHDKLLDHRKSLHEQFKKNLEKSKSNFLHKLEADKADKSEEAELELSSAEIKKVLADRVKSRAAKSHIRFTNDELVELMKKATAKLNHDHILKVRTRASRTKRYINMKLLNEASKHQELKKESKLNSESEESFEMIPKKRKSSSPKHIIISPVLNKPKQIKKFPFGKERDAESPSSESLDSSDFYFDDEISKEHNKFQENLPKLKTRKQIKSLPIIDVGKTKNLARIPHISGQKTKDHEIDDENEFERKYMRLDEYFRNAKEVLENFDDIDFSDESYYDNMDSHEKPNRSKRKIAEEKNDECKTLCNCGCNNVEKLENNNNCTCNCRSKEEPRMIETLLNNDSKGNLEEYLKNIVKKLVGMNPEKKEEKEKPSKSKRSADPRYKSLCENYRKHPLPQQKNRTALKYPIFKEINDLPLYEHLLHPRSVNDNDINESNESNLNKIEKEFDPEYRNYQIVFPNKDKFGITRNNSSVKLFVVHENQKTNLNKHNTTVLNSTIVSSVGNKTDSVATETTVHDVNNDTIVSVHSRKKNISNIQKISKNNVDSTFQNIFIISLLSYVE
ncbi:hypothetical protein HHI36_007047 [Cryptolaemus montrouzieri]|uniref:Nuclear receptor domain-containing protein n=1 Tax=Cryptolaemus montrouzieri TaxID=559131 RepID=A0ABD2MND4_9CUCU